MKGYAGIMCGAVVGFAIAVVAGVLILGTHLFDQGVERLGFSKLTFVYYVACLSLSIAMLIVSPAARKQAKLMWLFAIALLLVVEVGFQSFIESTSSSGDPLDAAKEMLNGIMDVGTKAYMYVMPTVVAVMYALIAFGAEEATKEAAKSLVPSKD
jgi:phosphoglycerol transferase MdoB-like AlkP superfamily enzyme